ncbi:unnamed protein product, partial [Rotaria socialis]
LEKEPESPSLVEQVTNIVSHIITDFTSHLPTLSTTETELTSEPSITEIEMSAPIAVDEEIIALKSTLDEQETAPEEASSTGLLETLKSYLPASMRSTELEEIISELPAESTKIDEETVASSSTPAVVTSVSEEHLTEGAESEKSSISSPVAGYFSSSDVYHAYKQPIEPVFEKESDSSSLVEQVTNIVSHIITDFTSHLPTLQSHEEVSQAPIIDGEKSTSEEKVIADDDTSSTGLLETLKSYLPASLLSAEITSETPTEYTKAVEVTVPSSSTDTVATTATTEQIEKTENELMASPVEDVVPDVSSSLNEDKVKVDAPKSVESVVPSTEEVQEMIVSKPLEVSKEEQQQQESSPVVSEITTSIVTTTTLPDT